MKKIEFIIERSADLFCAYSDNVPGGYGCGETVEKAKEEAIRGLELYFSENGHPLDEYEAVWIFDVESLLNHYKGIFTLAAIERMTGIKQRQLQHYMSGIKKPRIEQKRKIIRGLRDLGQELLTLEL